MNERSENRYFQRPHSHLTPRLQRTSANICMHKPYTARNYVPWATFFVADSIWVSLQMFDQFCPKAGNANPLVAEPEIDFNAKWPFKVIYFGIIEEPCTNGLQYIAQYYKCGFTRCEGSEDIASERSENRHFRPPHAHLTPLSSEPPRISA